MTAPDYLFINGNVWLGDEAPANALAVAVTGNRITAVAAEEQILDTRDQHTTVIDCRGGLVIPGFHDAHLHPLIGATDLLDCSLMGLKGWDEYRDHIKLFVGRNPDISFVRGNGWVHGFFPPPGPHRRLLDEVVSDRPAFFKAMDGHSGWCNSVALHLAGISRETSDPPGGIIERDPQTGEPTGLLRKMPAMQLVTDHLPQPGEKDLLAAADVFFDQAVRFGMTSVQDASGKNLFPNVYARLETSGRLNTLRVTLVRRFAPGRGFEQLDEADLLRRTHYSPFFRIGPLKIFMDGVVEGETAWLLEDYSDRPGHRGEPVWEPQEWLETVPQLARRGWSVHLHAVGDAAVRLGLDGIARARAATPDGRLRHQIAHADLISDADIPRFHEYDVIANLQPSWFARDSNFPSVTFPALGDARSKRLYRLRDLYNCHARTAFSSDWPFGGDITSFNPLVGIETGIRRIHPEGADQPLNASQQATLVEMLRGFTSGAAYAVGREHEIGRLFPGYLADLTVIQPNLFTIPAEQIHLARATLTMVDGRLIRRDI